MDRNLAQLEHQLSSKPHDLSLQESLAGAYVRAGRYETREEALFLLKYPTLSTLLHTGYPEALETLSDLLRSDDVSPPSCSEVRDLLFREFEEHPHKAEEFRKLLQPLFQMEPVFKYRDVGFQRVVQNFDENRLLDMEETYVNQDLRDRWRMDEGSYFDQGRIVRWKIVIHAGEQDVLQERNIYAGKGLEDQLQKTLLEYYRKQLQLMSKIQYVLIQKQAMRQLNDGMYVPFRVILQDPVRENGAPISYGGWEEGGLSFDWFDPNDDGYNVCFPRSIVIEVPKKF